jgi:Tol biopolymer transport system component
MRNIRKELFWKKLCLLKRFFWKVIFMGIIATSCAPAAKTDDLPNWIKHQPAGINFVDFAPSPDGKVIAFEYIDRSLGRNYLGIGMFNWKTGKLTRIPNPAGQQLSTPSFSEDGKHLLVGISKVNALFPNQIGTVDLTTMKSLALTSSGLILAYPVFQPRTGNIIYVQSTHGLMNGLNLFNTTTKKEQVIIDEKNGFSHISRLSFIGANEIIFQARSPSDMELRQKAMEFSAKPLAYRLKFGGKPQFISLEAERQSMKIIGSEGAYSHISASLTGDFIAYMSAVPSNPTEDQGKILRELFRLENGKTVQLTNHRSTILVSRTSYDGSAIAFAADVTEANKFDLFVYNTQTGETIATNLLDRIKNDSTFNLK